MTREEAIRTLDTYRRYADGISTDGISDSTAFDMAIEALQDRPSGKWNTFYREDAPPFLRTIYYCSHCGEGNTYGKSDFCPMCGADMRGGADD